MLSCHLLCFLGYKPRYPLTRLFDFSLDYVYILLTVCLNTFILMSVIGFDFRSLSNERGPVLL